VIDEVLYADGMTTLRIEDLSAATILAAKPLSL
jgi:hypothetical protein